MKKMLGINLFKLSIVGLSILFLFCLNLTVSAAGADLIIKDLVIKSETFEPKGVYHYVLEIQNIGDRDAVTRLPASLYFKGIVEPPVSYNTGLTAHLSEPRSSGTKPTSSMIIILPDNSEKSVVPEYKSYTYFAPPETTQKIQERKDEFLMRVKDKGYTQEQISSELANLEKTYGNYHEITLNDFFITLHKGETVRYESDKTYNQMYPLKFPVGPLSIDPIQLEIAVQLDPFSESDNNLANNNFVKKVTISPNVIQGPKPKSEKNVELEDETEYFAYSAGCTIINNKEICVSTDEQEELLFISVNGQKETYSFYGLFLAWINKIFGDGKLAPTENNNNVEISLYSKGFKFKFVE